MLLTTIVEAIEREGPLPFEVFMRMALYHPHGGFFSGEVLRSEKAGDFLTSPEVSSMFGATLARFVDAERARLGTAECAIVEAGAGSGSLLRPLLDNLHGVPDCWALEVSPPAQLRLAELLGANRVVTEPEELPQFDAAVVLANELLDNLPMALAVKQTDGWSERFVDRGGEGLVLVDVPARSPVARWADRYGGTVPVGALVEVQLAAADWLQRMAARVVHGCLLLIDYGGTTEELVPRRTRGTLRTYRSHHLGPDPLLEPGATDITADVNVTAVAAVLEELEFSVEVHRQDDFLASWGLRDRLRELRHRELELAREPGAIERLQVRSQRSDAEALLHPRGLGDFRVVVARR